MARFNPRARVGRDLTTPDALHLLSSFNPRARGGRDVFGLPTNLYFHFKFQSTRPRGARRRQMRFSRVLLSFNPRARVGRDRLFSLAVRGSSSFNPRARVGRDCLFAKADPAYPNRAVCANAYRITVNII